MNNTKKTFLLVSFEDFNDVDKQEVLEIALDHGVFAYSCPEDENAIIFEAPTKDALYLFKSKLLYIGLQLNLKEFSR